MNKVKAAVLVDRYTSAFLKGQGSLEEFCELASIDLEDIDGYLQGMEVSGYLEGPVVFIGGVICSDSGDVYPTFYNTETGREVGFYAEADSNSYELGDLSEWLDYCDSEADDITMEYDKIAMPNVRKMVLYYIIHLAIEELEEAWILTGREHAESY